MKTLFTTFVALVAVILATATVGNSTRNISSAAGSNQNGTNIMFRKYHISITNNYKAEDNMHLQVQCWRDNEELDLESVAKGQSYWFWTRINLWRTTKCRCFVAEVWDDGRVGYSRYIVGFKATRDEHRCMLQGMTCFWSVREDGFYSSDDNVSWSFVYPWTE